MRNYYCGYEYVERLLAVVTNISNDKRDSVITVEAMVEPSDNESLYTVLHTISYELSEDENEWKKERAAQCCAALSVINDLFIAEDVFEYFDGE